LVESAQSTSRQPLTASKKAILETQSPQRSRVGEVEDFRLQSN
jgi:hypothetical protein